jgi:hypothetical protein
MRRSTSPQGYRPAFGCDACRAGHVRRQRQCHLYFARRVTFLSCADMETSALTVIRVYQAVLLGQRNFKHIATEVLFSDTL